MALLFIDGFDHSGTYAIHGTKYNTAVGPGAIVASPVRTGAGALQVSGGNSFAMVKGGYAFPLGTTLICGVAFRRSADAPQDQVLLVFQEAGGINHVSLALTFTGKLQLLKGAAQVATGPTTLAVNTWYYVELRASVHPTAGAYEVRLDGVQQFTASGVNTQSGGAGIINNLVLLAPPDPVLWYYDDLYFCDGSGAAPLNNFLGPVKVETLLPQTDAVQAGSNQGLTPSVGTDHGAMVDEVPPNNSDYNFSAVIGAKDTYQYPPMALHGAILGVQTNLYVQKADAAARQVCAVLRSGGTDFDGANVAPLTTFAYFSEVRALNPATGGAWTEAAISTLEAGMKVTG